MVIAVPSPLLLALEPLLEEPLLPQAARAKTMTSARTIARVLFIFSSFLIRKFSITPLLCSNQNEPASLPDFPDNGHMKRYMATMLKLTHFPFRVNRLRNKLPGQRIILYVFHILCFENLYEIKRRKNNVSRKSPFLFRMDMIIFIYCLRIPYLSRGCETP